MTMKEAIREFLDKITEFYARDVDVTMINEVLRRTVEERLRALQDFGRCQDELRAAMERALDEDR
jgi:hypothetical protein